MISIIIPTIRPDNIPSILDNIHKTTRVSYLTYWKEDRERIGAPRMVKKLVDLTITEWVVFMGDDTLLEYGCIDNALQMATEKDLWLVGFNDAHGQKATHWLASKKLLDHLENREFFYTGYIHNFCDDELRVRAESLGKYGWCESARIIHNHPIFGNVKMDDTYKIQTDRSAWDHDQNLFYKRCMNEPEKKPTLGIVMIVKNESQVLADCLNSVKDADAIFIADTGSLDNTVEIARMYTPHVYTDFLWCDDFAEARNFIKAKATTDYLLSIDADEVLDTGGIEEIRKIISASPDLSFGIKMKRRSSDEFYVPRLFKNVPQVQWDGLIHETINVLQNKNYEVGITYGSSPAHTLDPDRNLRMLEKAHRLFPTNTRCMYYLGREYGYRKEWQKAEAILEEYVANPEATYLREKADAYFVLALCYWYDGNSNGEKARLACLSAMNINSHFKAPILLMAHMSFAKNAVQWKRMAETATDEDTLFSRARFDTI